MCIRDRVNVENVVNPPHNPTTKNKYWLDIDFSVIEINIPSAKQPIKFAKNVEYGYPVFWIGNKTPNKYLSVHPIPPPRKT